MSAEQWEWLTGMARNDGFCLATRVVPHTEFARDYIVRTTERRPGADTDLFDVEVLYLRTRSAEIASTIISAGWRAAIEEHFNKCRKLEKALKCAIKAQAWSKQPPQASIMRFEKSK